MKTTIYTFALLAVLLTSCSVGTNKDFNTGLSYSYNGFMVDRVVLVAPDNTVKGDNVVPLESSVGIAVEGLSGFELKDDKAFPGLMLRVTDKSGANVLNEADLFANSDGYSQEDASSLRGTVRVGNPMKANETYHVTMRVWDKNNVENEINVEVDIEVK